MNLKTIQILLKSPFEKGEKNSPKSVLYKKSVNKAQETKQKAIQDIPEAVSKVHTYAHIYTVTAKESSFIFRAAFISQQSCKNGLVSIT